MESKQILKPRCPDWHSKEKERQIKERDALEEKKKSKYLYRGLEESDESESDNELKMMFLNRSRKRVRQAFLKF